jgi:hypothetical protein
MLFRPLALLLLAVAGAGLSRFAWPTPVADAAPVAPAAMPYGVHGPAFAPLSAVSCAAASCHGGGQVGRKGSEHSTWAPNEARGKDRPADPHANGYRVLFSADSARMVKAVGGGPAYRNNLCLKCHAVPEVRPAAAMSEGVSCGACHGPADGWLAAHVHPGWAGVPNRERWNRYGFAPTKNLVARSLICASCHVGDADREVNHDLIAAGHPRLAFESARSHFRPSYRKHWTERTPTAEFEVRAWVIGQVASLRAAVELLRARAGRAAETDSRTPWPEFAGQSCYACHHPISDKPVSPGPRPLGRAGWEIWPTAAVEVAARFTTELYPGVPVPRWKSLPKLQAEMGKVVPDATTVTRLAADATAELDLWLVAVQAAEDCGPPAPPADITRRIAHALAGHALSADRKAVADRDWDALAAHYLGCAAMYHASGGAKVVPTWSAPVRGLAGLLTFPAGYVSPKDFDDTKREQVRQQFAALFDATTEPGEKR